MITGGEDGKITVWSSRPNDDLSPENEADVDVEMASSSPAGSRRKRSNSNDSDQQVCACAYRASGGVVSSKVNRR